MDRSQTTEKKKNSTSQKRKADSNFRSATKKKKRITIGTHEKNKDKKGGGIELESPTSI